jgi:hypothetical protein
VEMATRKTTKTAAEAEATESRCKFLVTKTSELRFRAVLGHDAREVRFESAEVRSSGSRATMLCVPPITYTAS